MAIATPPTTPSASPPTAPIQSSTAEWLGKDRSPAAILGLSIITFGIYFLVWHYKINAEIRRHDPDIKVSPGLSVIAMLFPIANLVAAYGTAARIRQMQLDDGLTQTISPIVALLLIMLLGIGYPLYIASAMREHWHMHRRSQRMLKPA
jgi:drug/metabolite transporter (DMT)-like permease